LINFKIGDIMVENLNFNLGVVGDGKDHRDRPKPRFEKSVRLGEVIQWINNQNWDDYTKKKLIAAASAYPHGGLRHFADSINAQITRISIERQKENEEQKKENEEGKEES